MVAALDGTMLPLVLRMPGTATGLPRQSPRVPDAAGRPPGASPSRAIAASMAAPRPRAAPVITATFPSFIGAQNLSLLTENYLLPVNARLVYLLLFLGNPLVEIERLEIDQIAARQRDFVETID